MVITFKEVIEELKEFTTNHYQTHEFGWGNVNNISKNNHKFPLIYVQPIPSNINAQQFNLKLEIYVCDVVSKDLINELDVMNNTLLIGNDIIVNYFNNLDENRFELDENNVLITPFSAEFDDNLGGWIFEVTIQFENNMDTCIIPLK